MYCIECGAEGEDLIGNLCKKCFLDRHALITIPSTIDVTVCAHCGALMKGEKAVGPAQAGLEDRETREVIARAAIDDAVNVEKGAHADLDVTFEELDKRNIRAAVLADVAFQGRPIVERSITTIVRFRNSVCIKCSRQKGFYFEAVIQLRSEGRELEESDMDGLESTIDSVLNETGGFVSKVDQVRGGFDYYLSSTSDAKGISLRMAKEMGAKVTESNTLVGRKDGIDMYRLTYAVRLPAYRVGDYFVIDDALARVTAVSKGRVTFMDIMTRRKKGLKSDELAKRITLIGGRSHLRKAVIVSMSKHEVQVMDPDDFKTTDLKRPPWLTDGTHEVDVVKHEGTLYLVETSDEKED